MAIEIVDVPMKNVIIIHSYVNVSQRVDSSHTPIEFLVNPMNPLFYVGKTMPEWRHPWPGMVSLYHL